MDFTLFGKGKLLPGIKIRELTNDEVYGLVDSYIHAAGGIKESGFDGVQLHAAHSWILSAFLSPVTNKRTDEWGGSSEKRTGIVKKICEGIRNVVGNDYPLMVKLGIKDYHPEGKSIDDGILQAQILESAGVDSIEVSEGLEQDFFHHIRADVTAPYYLEECRRVKNALSIPVMLVGGMRKLEDMQRVITSGTADAVSMCRPFIMDPHLITHLKSGSLDGSNCPSCNQCMRRMGQGKLECVLV